MPKKYTDYIASLTPQGLVLEEARLKREREDSKRYEATVASARLQYLEAFKKGKSYADGARNFYESWLGEVDGERGEKR